jgi:oligopeptide/dipeptide ABC transporter ATP-binding protein
VLEPKVIIADEPVSNLDASVRGEILALLMKFRDELQISLMIVTHDLGLAWNIADRVAVMYLGRIVELATSVDLYREPLMPYTQALLSAVPVPEPGAKKARIVLTGDVPSPANLPPGCVFHPRCQHPAKDEACTRIIPPLEEKAPAHFVACIKQTPTAIDWDQQKAAGGTKQPTRYLPVVQPA